MNDSDSGTHHDRSEVGRDLLDAQVGGAGVGPLRITDIFGRTRAALGLKPLAAPALIFVPLGAAIGPTGAGWISPPALGHLYGVTAVALAALGIFVGFGLRLDRPQDRRLLQVASLEALITITIVAVGCAILLSAWGARLDASLTVIALVLGLCASATSAGEVTAGASSADRAALHIADLDDALPIVLGGIVLAIGLAQTLTHGVTLAFLNIVVPLAIAAAGWLLFGQAPALSERSPSRESKGDTGERAVFVVGVVALLGGGAAYLGVSPLLAGMVAGLSWKYAPGRADAIIAEDLRRLQHPLVVLLLIVAGAGTEPSLLALWMAGLYVIIRVNGKLIAGWLVSRAIPTLSPANLGSSLLPPGVIGLAFALAFHMASLTAASSAVLTAVAMGTLASEVLAALVLFGPKDV